MQNKIKQNLNLIIPPILTIFILLTTYIAKGVYPFGNSNIAYYDMNQLYIPLYARNYDISHGSGSLLFDWLEGAGMDMTSTFPEMSLHPLNWLFFFIKPDHILHYMALFLLIKLVITSFNISLYIKRIHNVSPIVHIILCMMYTFSGYLLQFYSNTFFLDSMMLLPLLMLTLRYMFYTGNGIPYILVLAFQLITKLYLGIMTLIFLMFYSFGYIFTLDSKKNKKIFSAKLGIYTMLSILLSAIVDLPVLMKWTTTFRSENNIIDLSILKAENNAFFSQKLFELFNTSIIIAFLILLLYQIFIKKNKIDKELKFYLFIFFIMLIPIFNEPSLLLWHMGSYVHFPYRNGYMFAFTAIELIACFWKANEKTPFFTIKSRIIQYILIISIFILSFTSFIILIKMDMTFIDYGIHEGRASYYGDVMSYFLSALAFFLIIMFCSKKAKEFLFFSLTLLKIIITAICFIAPLKYSATNPFMYYTTGDNFIEDTIQLRNNAGLKNDYISRIKVLYPSLSKNYSLILGYPSINQWSTEVDSDFYNEIIYMGYGHDLTSNLDCGGTIFSDALLNNKKIIVYGNSYVPEKIFKKDRDISDYSIYDMNYTLPFGMLCNENILHANINDLSAADYVDYSTFMMRHQEQLAKVFGGESLFEEIHPVEPQNTADNENRNNYFYEYNIHFNSPSVLYAVLPYEYVSQRFTINGTEIYFPYFEELNNTQKRMSMNDIVLLGYFDADEDITLCVENNIGETDINRFFMINLDSFKNLQEKYKLSSVSNYKVGKNRLDLTVDVKESNYLFLPLVYYDGWTAKVNGVKTEVLPVINDAFMAIKLPSGHCNVTMHYFPPTIIHGSIISLIALILFISLIISKKKNKDITKNRLIYSISYVVFNLVSVVALFIFYVLPILAGLLPI